MITQQTADKAKSLLKIQSQFDWRHDPEHPDFGAKESVDHRKWLAEAAWLQHPLRELMYLAGSTREPKTFSTAMDTHIWSYAAAEARHRERSLREDIDTKIQDLVGADSIETDGAFFSDSSDETVQAILRKVGAKDGAVFSEWSLSPHMVKYETIKRETAVSFKFSEPEAPTPTDDSSIPVGFLILLGFLIGLIIVLASVAGGGQ